MTHIDELKRTTADERKDEHTISSIVNHAQEVENRFVNLTIKVSRQQRLHWLIEAKKQGTSLTAAITKALNERFGVIK